MVDERKGSHYWVMEYGELPLSYEFVMLPI